MRCSAGVLCMRYPGCRITGTVVRACLIQLNFASHHPQASFNWLVTLCARRPRRAASYEHGACQQDNAGLLILCICRLCTVVGATGAALAELCAGHEIHFTGAALEATWSAHNWWTQQAAWMVPARFLRCKPEGKADFMQHYHAE
ncbi:hypothetical protein D9Q98_006325 [Chlorella vulgaris]|uniref:Uncharacterized protein n=1 Tax=Chlorella vulgaris TaxID=3077 RepID=A0A9D4YV77_CHLVU|nr:hypothetical protein D9Q98_006325 [Chlorella vulgaris]